MARREKIILPKPDNQDAFWMEISFDEFDPVVVAKVEKIVAKELFPVILEKVKKDIPNLLEPANFYGEAEQYMFENGILFTKEVRNKYASAIYNDFIKVVDKLVDYNEEDGTILISPYILALEYGDYYRPALNFISKLIEEHFKKLNKNTDN